MSLFDATVSQIVKDVSDKTLIPVPNRSSADYCKILSLIERKTRSWHLPWKSPFKYVPTELTLNDILIKPVDVKDLQSSSVMFQNYTSTPSFHKAGKIGGKIAEEFEVDLNVNETIQISLKLGNVKKQEILWQKLHDALNGKMVQVDHPLLKVINNSSKKSLFIITMIVTSGSTSCLDEDTSLGGDLGGSPQVSLNLNSSASSDSKQHRQYTIPLGTTLAYCCCKLKVDSNGVLSLQLGEDVIDAPFVKEEKIDEAQVQDALSGLLTNKVNKDLIMILRKILKTRPKCAFMLNIVVENAIDILQEEIMQCKITFQHLSKLFPEESAADCFTFLETAGFQIKQEEKKLVYPENLDMLTSLNVFLDCLSEMNNAQIQALLDCDISHRSVILLVMQKAIKSATLNEDDKVVSEMFIESHPIGRFLGSIGVSLASTNSTSRVIYLPERQSVLQLRSAMVAALGMCSV